MFAPKTISSGAPLTKSAKAARAPPTTASVSALVGYAQCALPLWW
jgi:hypothetical protein